MQVKETPMDRRAFMTRSVLLAAAGCPGFAMPALGPAIRTPGSIAVYDSTLAHGRALAEHAASGGLPAFDTGDDIGALWYDALGPHLAQTRGLLIGVTRRSDYFVLTQFITHTIGACALQRDISRTLESTGTSHFIFDCTTRWAT
jgi:hypothetical protein